LRGLSHPIANVAQVLASIQLIYCNSTQELLPINRERSQVVRATRFQVLVTGVKPCLGIPKRKVPVTPNHPNPNG